MKVFTITTAILAACLVAPALAQEGAVAGGVSTTSSYTCDPNTCKLPNCLCASTSPPGGLQPKDTPQFVVITFDDSVQPKLLQTAQDLLNVK